MASATDVKQSDLRHRSITINTPTLTAPMSARTTRHKRDDDAQDEEDEQPAHGVHTACGDACETCSAKCRWNWEVFWQVSVLILLLILTGTMLYVLWLIVSIFGPASNAIGNASELSNDIMLRTPYIFNTTDRVLNVVNSVVDSKPGNFSDQLYQSYNQTRMLISSVHTHWPIWMQQINQTMTSVTTITPDDVEFLVSNVQQLLFRINRANINETIFLVQKMLLHVDTVYQAWNKQGQAQIAIDLSSFLGLKPG